MATDGSRSLGDAPEDPQNQLPPDSVLGLDEYLDVHAAVGHRTRYEILYRLVHGGDTRLSEFEAVLAVDDSTLHYHLKRLVEVGLVEKRQRTERGQDGFSTYYRATVFGEVTLTSGVDELMRGEREFAGMDDSAADS